MVVQWWLVMVIQWWVVMVNDGEQWLVILNSEEVVDDTYVSKSVQKWFKNIGVMWIYRLCLWICAHMGPEKLLNGQTLDKPIYARCVMCDVCNVCFCRRSWCWKSSRIPRFRDAMRVIASNFNSHFRHSKCFSTLCQLNSLLWHRWAFLFDDLPIEKGDVP